MPSTREAKHEMIQTYRLDERLRDRVKSTVVETRGDVNQAAEHTGDALELGLPLQHGVDICSGDSCGRTVGILVPDLDRKGHLDFLDQRLGLRETLTEA